MTHLTFMITQQLINDNQNFLYYLFHITAGLLYGLSLITHLSYQFWNIAIWFGLIPASWIWLLSKRTTPWINVFSIPLFVYMFYTASWNKWFDQAVVLLYKIGAIIHSDYKLTSVYVCVFLPILIYGILFYLFTSKKTFKIFLITLVIFTTLLIIFFPISNMLIKDPALIKLNSKIK